MKTDATTNPTSTTRVDQRPRPRTREATSAQSAGPGFRGLLRELGERCASRGAHREGALDGALDPSRALASHERIARRAEGDRDPGDGARDGGDRDPSAERELATFEPFTPPPSVLTTPFESAPATARPPAAGTARGHAEIAALAERLVTSMRVGRVGRDGHEVRMRIALTRDAGLDVQLRMVAGSLSACLVAPPHATEEAEGIARTLERELRARGVDVDEVRVETH